MLGSVQHSARVPLSGHINVYRLILLTDFHKGYMAIFEVELYSEADIAVHGSQVSHHVHHVNEVHIMQSGWP